MSFAEPEFEACWKQVVDGWHDERVHNRFLEFCRLRGKLGEGAARYAGMRGDRERAELARKKLEAITLLAQLELATLKEERPSPLPRWARMLVGSFFLALIVYVVFRVSAM